MSHHYEIPQGDCRKCTGYTFPGGYATFCNNSLSSASGHCLGQFDCDKKHRWSGNGSEM